ncbi:MAG: class II fructose-bisphosphate aldolase [Candidatus Azambacteria bacterium]|nr:class II fructose-bisphosphate aldolase [Candidatus Azambacteria bacterium]
MNLNTKQFFSTAEKGGYAIGQFNASTADQIRAIMRVATELRAPVIIGTSEGECKFIGARQVVKLCEAYEEEGGVPIILNADHTYKDAQDIENLDMISALLKAGYNSIHFDGSVLSFEENVKWTKQVVALCKEKDPRISVEGEIGFLPGASEVSDKKVEIKPEYLTDPKQALEFVQATGVDRLAVSVGNSHGISFQEDRLDIARIIAIKEAVGDHAVLVLHGGSGIPDDQIRDAITSGIRKININTELRIAFHDALKATLVESSQTTPYKFLPPAMDAVARVVEGKIKLFGSGGGIL